MLDIVERLVVKECCEKNIVSVDSVNVVDKQNCPYYKRGKCDFFGYKCNGPCIATPKETWHRGLESLVKELERGSE